MTTDLGDSTERVEDVGEAVRDALERRLHEVERRGRERDARDQAATARVPAEAPLAAEERQERQAVRCRLAIGEACGVDVAQGAAEPGEEVAAGAQRAALAEAAIIEAVEEEPRLRLRPLRLVHDPQRARRSDHQRGAAAADASRADVRARAVASCGNDVRDRVVADRRQRRDVEAEQVESLLVPGEPVRVEEAGAGRGGDRRCELPREPQQQVVAERDVPGRAHALLAETRDLRRPVRRMLEAPVRRW